MLQAGTLHNIITQFGELIQLIEKQVFQKNSEKTDKCLHMPLTDESMKCHCMCYNNIHFI